MPLLRDRNLIKATHMRFDSFFFMIMSYLLPVLFIPVYLNEDFILGVLSYGQQKKTGDLWISCLQISQR